LKLKDHTSWFGFGWIYSPKHTWLNISFAKVNVGVRGFGTTLGLHTMFIS